MVAPIVHALAKGYSAKSILNYVSRTNPQYATAINTALAANYTADTILGNITKANREDSDEIINTELAKYRNQLDKNERDRTATLIGTAGTLGAAAFGLYSIYNRNAPVYPSQIIQGPRNPPQQRGIPQRAQPQQLPYNPTRQGPQNPRQPPQLGGPTNGPRQPTPNTPAPAQAPQTPTHNPEKNISFIKNIGEDTRVQNILSQFPNVAMAASVLRKVIPKHKVALMEKAEGGFEQALSDYNLYIQSQPPAIREQAQAPQMQPQQQNLPEQRDQQQAQESIMPVPQPNEQIQQERTPEISNELIMQMPSSSALKAHQNAFSGQQPKTKSQISPLRKSSFAIPNYRFPGEPEKDFQNRKIINQAVNRAAKELKEGKSFLDFPVKEGTTYSVDADVLKFIAGVPNIYDSLLDDDEKDELMEGISSNKEIEKYTPNMAPSLVWNLLLSIEPKLSEIEKPVSTKGGPPGTKMKPEEFRKYLAHSVYRAIEGESISPNLADKINKISNVTSKIDAIAKAAHDGNFRKVNEVMHQLSDDEYLFSLFTEEVEEMVSAFGKKGLGIKGSAADTRYANDLQKKRMEQIGNGTSSEKSRKRKVIGTEQGEA